MSIVTKTGDGGTTGLMYNRRVPKHHPRVAAYGAVDELNAALGLARATTAETFVAENLLSIQKDLVVLMGELCVQSADLPRYFADGFSPVTPAMTAKLEVLVREVESQNISFKGWATPGANPSSATLDVARAVCRRAERSVSVLEDTGETANPEILIFLNRLSDLLWLLARWTEARPASRPRG
jgi:cob(I)alamin adenosyltransferase